MGRKDYASDDERAPLLPDQPVKKRSKNNPMIKLLDRVRMQSQGYRKVPEQTAGDAMKEYYNKQAGSGIGGFSGLRYQKGDGFFGRMVSGAILPLIKKVLPFLGTAALSTGVNIMSDLSEGQKFGDSARRRFKDTAQHIENRAMAKVRSMTGSGKRRRKTTKKPVKRKPVRRQKKKPVVKKRRVIRSFL